MAAAGILYPTALAREQGARAVGVSALLAKPLWVNAGVDVVRIFVDVSDGKVRAKAYHPPAECECFVWGVKRVVLSTTQRSPPEHTQLYCVPTSLSFVQ